MSDENRCACGRTFDKAFGLRVHQRTCELLPPTDPGPVPEEEGDPFEMGVEPLDESRPVELVELVGWLLNASMCYTNAVELLGSPATAEVGVHRLHRTHSQVSPTLFRLAVTIMRGVFPDGIEVEGVEIVGMGGEPDAETV